jgi:hypothetical protein
MPLHPVSSSQSMHEPKTSPQAQFADVGAKPPTYLGEIENDFALYILSKDRPPQRTAMLKKRVWTCHRWMDDYVADTPKVEHRHG